MATILLQYCRCGVKSFIHLYPTSSTDKDPSQSVIVLNLTRRQWITKTQQQWYQPSLQWHLRTHMKLDVFPVTKSMKGIVSPFCLLTGSSILQGVKTRNLNKTAGVRKRCACIFWAQHKAQRSSHRHDQRDNAILNNFGQKPYTLHYTGTLLFR